MPPAEPLPCDSNASRGTTVADPRSRQGVESVGAESVNHDAAAQLMAPEVTAALQKALRAEKTAHAELQKHVVGSLRGDADAGDAHVAKLRAQV